MNIETLKRKLLADAGEAGWQLDTFGRVRDREYRCPLVHAVNGSRFGDLNSAIKRSRMKQDDVRVVMAAADNALGMSEEMQVPVTALRRWMLKSLFRKERTK